MMKPDSQLRTALKSRAIFQAIKELKLDYVPKTRESRFVKVPSVISVAGTDLVVVSESATDLYQGIEKTMKKEQLSKRDVW